MIVVEIKAASLFRILDLQRTDQTGRLGSKEKEAVDQFRLVLGIETDGESALELRDAGDFPVVDDTAGKALPLRDGKLPIVADYETLLRVEKRESAAGVEIEWIERFFKS